MATNCLKDAVNAWRAGAKQGLDPEVASLLERLEASKEAANSFETFGAAFAGRVLKSCIQAAELARTFNDRIEGAKKEVLGERRGKRTAFSEDKQEEFPEVMASKTHEQAENINCESANVGRLDGLDKAVCDLRSFVKVFDCEPTDELSAVMRYDPADVETMKRGLHLLATAIEGRRRIATETRLRLGATRKSLDGGKAAETAAIGWLAASVRSICRQPHSGAVATLAETLLNCRDVVLVDRVRKAEQIHDREWRLR